MIFKNAFLAGIVTAIALLIAPEVRAQEIKTLEDYLDFCIREVEGDPIPRECESFDRNTELDLIEEEEEEDTKENSGVIGGYTGATIGIFFPDIDESRPIFQGNDVDIDNGFGGSLFAGIKFNRYFGTDLEFNSIVGGVDSDLDEDESYVIWSLYLNPRLFLPLTGNKNSVSLFLSPGIGISQLLSTVEDDVDDFDRTTTIEDDPRFTWQVKGGVSIPVSSKFSILVQVRYASQTGDDAIDYLGSEVGVNFDF